jgi:hypothetical protein
MALLIVRCVYVVQKQKGVADAMIKARPASLPKFVNTTMARFDTPGQSIEYYMGFSDGTTADAGLATTGTTLGSDKRRNLTFVGVLVVDQPNSNTTMTASWRNLYIPSRYVSLAMWNNTGLNTETSPTKHKCVLIPMPFQMQ